MDYNLDTLKLQQWSNAGALTGADGLAIRTSDSFALPVDGVVAIALLQDGALQQFEQTTLRGFAPIGADQPNIGAQQTVAVLRDDAETFVLRFDDGEESVGVEPAGGGPSAVVTIEKGSGSSEPFPGVIWFPPELTIDFSSLDYDSIPDAGDSYDLLEFANLDPAAAGYEVARLDLVRGPSRDDPYLATVSLAPRPTLEFEGPERVAAGGIASFTFEGRNVDDCDFLDGFASPSVSISASRDGTAFFGSAEAPIEGQDRVFTIICFGPGGEVEQSLLVSENRPPQPAFGVDPLVRNINENAFSNQQEDPNAFLGFFADPEGDPLTISVAGSSNPGLIDPRILYCPGDGFCYPDPPGTPRLFSTLIPNASGTAEVSLRATDSFGDFAERVVFVWNVAPVNDPPFVVAPIPDQSVPQGSGTLAFALAPVFGDDGGVGELVYSATTDNPGLVTVLVEAGGLELDFEPGATGSAVIAVVAQDAQGLTASTSFVVEVFPVNGPPVVIEPLKDTILFEDAPDLTLDMSVVFADPDTDSGDVLSYAVSAVNGIVTQSPDATPADTVRLRFAADTVGEDSVTITATDSFGEVAASTFDVELLAIKSAGILGQNVNIVGPTPADPKFYPDFTRKQQNEVDCGGRPDNFLQLFCAMNDYRGADDADNVGDGWQGVAMSRDGGLTWISRLAPGFKAYPLDGQPTIEGPEDPVDEFPRSLNTSFSADPAVAPLPGAMMLGFISSDRQNKGPGGFYLQRWFERSSEVGFPYTPEAVTRRVAAGGGVPAGEPNTLPGFIDKDELVFMLGEPGRTVTETVTLEDGTVEEVALPEGVLTAGFTLFRDESTGIQYFEDFSTFAPGPLPEGAGDAGGDWITSPGAAVEVLSVTNPADTAELFDTLVFDGNGTAGPFFAQTPAAEAFATETTRDGVPRRLLVDAGFRYFVECPTAADGGCDPAQVSPNRIEVLGVRAGTAPEPLFVIDVNGSRGSFRSQAVDGDGALSEDPQTFPITANQWSRVDLQFDFTANTVDVFLDFALFAVGVPIPENVETFTGLRFNRQPTAGLADRFFVEQLGFRSMFSTGAEIYVTSSVDSGRSWTVPRKISDNNEVNQGVSLAAGGGRILAVWRRFEPPVANADQGDALVYSVFPASGTIDLQNLSLAQLDGLDWSPARLLPVQPGGAPSEDLLCPMDQKSGIDRFRSNGFPTAVWDEGAGVFRVFVADRRFASIDAGLTASKRCDEGLSRIVMLSANGSVDSFSAPVVLDDAGDQPLPGHQLMPGVSARGDQVQVGWYDSRNDATNLVNPFIDDRFNASDGLLRRTIDVRAARVTNGIVRPSIQVTQFQQGLNDDGQIIQLETFFPNGRIFEKGNTPFIGDYLSVAGQPYVLEDSGDGSGERRWRMAQPSDPPGSFFLAWADNRNIRGDVWNEIDGATQFSPIDRTAEAPADPSGELTLCTPGDDLSLTRDQDVFGAMLHPGLKLSAPVPLKPLDQLQRAYVLYVQNFTNNVRSYEAVIENQPADGRASFSEFLDEPALTLQELTLPARSSAALTVFLQSSEATPPIGIRVTETNCTSCESDLLVLNGNPLAPDFVDDPENPSTVVLEVRDPVIENRVVNSIENPGFLNPGFLNPGFLNPGFLNPGFLNPGFLNPGFLNPGFLNPGFLNVDFENPGFLNPGFLNPGFLNPGFLNSGVVAAQYENPGFLNPGFLNTPVAPDRTFNPGIQNPGLDGFNVERITDVSWQVTNTGTSTGAFDLRPFFTTVPDGARTQLIVTRTYLIPTIRDCELTALVKNQVILNVVDPDVSGFDRDTGLTTVFAAPGDLLVVTLRVFLPEGADDVAVETDAASPQKAGLVVTAQACDTGVVCDEQADPDRPIAIEGEQPVFEFATPTDGGIVYEQGSASFNRRSRIWSVPVTVTNETGAELPGEFRAVVDSNLDLLNGSGTTDAGEDYVDILTGSDVGLAPGDSATVIVSLRSSRRVRPAINTRLEFKPRAFELP